jgi:hypothetical protein
MAAQFVLECGEGITMIGRVNGVPSFPRKRESSNKINPFTPILSSSSGVLINEWFDKLTMSGNKLDSRFRGNDTVVLIQRLPK